MSLPRWPRLFVALLAIAGAFAAGRAMGARAVPGGEPSDRDGAADEPLRSYDVADPNAPLWAPLARWSLPTVGSVFRNRFSVAKSPLDGVEAVLVSPRDSECMTECPLALRQVDRETAEATLPRLFPSFGPDVTALGAAVGTPVEVSNALRAAAAALGAEAAARPGGDAIPVRALFVGMPRPDFGPGAWSVGLSVTNLPDPHFDRERRDLSLRPGWRLMLSRVESREADGPRTRLLGGALLVGWSATTGWERQIPAGATDLGAVFGTLWGHFGGLPEEVAGLCLDRQGRVWSFGSDLALRSLPPSDALRRALEAFLRRA